MQFFTFTSLLAVVGAVAVPLEKRQYAGVSTENQFTGSNCKAITILFARGTTEAGNVGSLAGPPFFQAVASLVGAGSLTVQGVNYAADVAGFLEGGDPAGSATLASLIARVQSGCPSTKLVVSGYSQGGQLVHNAANLISASATAFIDSVVIFGDPDDGKPVGRVPASKTLIICHVGDNICAGGDEVLEPHLTYSENAGQAAAFVVAQARS